MEARLLICSVLPESPVFIFNDLIFNEFSENEKRNLRIINMAVKKNELYFVQIHLVGYSDLILQISRMQIVII